jgi:hypothetical protein
MVVCCAQSWSLQNSASACLVSWFSWFGHPLDGPPISVDCRWAVPAESNVCIVPCQDNILKTHVQFYWLFHLLWIHVDNIDCSPRSGNWGCVVKHATSYFVSASTTITVSKNDSVLLPVDIPLVRKAQHYNIKHEPFHFKAPTQDVTTPTFGSQGASQPLYRSVPAPKFGYTSFWNVLHFFIWMYTRI